MLAHLASDKPSERKLTVRVLGFFASENQFPPELVAPLVEIASSDAQEIVANSASEVLQYVADGKEPGVAQVATKGLETLPPRVNVHVSVNS